MKFDPKTVRKTINKAFLKEPVERTSFNHFKDSLGQLLDQIDSAQSKNEHEEHFKNFLVSFFNRVGFDDYKINTSGRIDLAIYTGAKAKDPVGVLMEVKRPSNSNEMITKDQLNRKAMHEAVLYYLEQRIEQDNSDLKHVIVTNMDDWFIFDAQEFERCFYKPSALRKTWNEWKADRKVSSNNDFMYAEISAFMDKQDTTITGLWLPLGATRKFLKGQEDSEYEKKLIPIYKLFSPTHLLKEPFANDSNSLNREFYRELLYILGLEETKKGSTRYIQRTDQENRQAGSFIENTIRILDAEDHLSTLKKELNNYGSDRGEQHFSVAMELSITWMNRILFLKLLEAQLYRYHRQDRKFKFLNYNVIDGLDELNKLFFQVLARKVKDRSADVNEKFGHIPFLNSSLFDVSPLEHQTTRISGLDDHAEMSVYSKSVLANQRGNTLNTLDYLFRFLESYDFSAEGSEEIRDERKSLINASVLGLIFEKINGYKDGSFYTPGFITEYMAGETLQKAVIDAFNEKYSWSCTSFDELYNELHREKLPFEEANGVINELKICDPAVGSGHFLVSCLNELIAIKSRLDILCDTDGKILRQIEVVVENDELIISWGDEGLFEYDVSHAWKGTKLASRRISPELERVQQALFHEKRYLIENCLFGVDINPNSVKICRLRLWIELLKRAYYTPESNYLELEVLPNIDINIKQGNSLVSRFELDSDLSTVFKNSDYSLEDYKEAVRNYKHTGDRAEKQRLQNLIDDIKEEYSTTLYNNLPINEKLSKARGKLDLMSNSDLFGEVKFTKKDIEKQKNKVKKLEDQRAEEESGAFYNQAFEWRFEFPEVLDDEGRFTGFDVVIGNPPYIRIQDLKESGSNIVDYINKNFRTTGKGNYDLYIPFIEQGINLLSDNGNFCFINSHKFTNARYGENLRRFLSENKYLYRFIDFGTQQVFVEATTYTALLFISKQSSYEIEYLKPEDPMVLSTLDTASLEVVPSDILGAENWSFITGINADLYNKLVNFSITLKEVTDRIFQGLKTSADKIYIVTKKEESRNSYLIYSDQNDSEFEVEKKLFHPLIKGGDSAAYHINQSDLLILFPYQDGELIKWKQIENEFPKTAKYLLANKKYLEKRERGRFKGNKWYQYGRSQAIETINKPKIFTPDISPKPRFSLDNTGEKFFTGGVSGGYGIIPIDGISFNYLLGVLNSKLCEWFISHTSTRMRGDWYSFESRYISKIPFPVADERLIKNIESNVYQIFIAKKQNPEADTIELEDEIERLVYELYGLSKEEIEVVEGGIT